MKILHAKAVAFSERPWEMDGRTGISRTLTTADGDSTDKLKLTDDLWARLPVDVRSFLANISNSEGFGSIVTAVFESGFEGKGMKATHIRVIDPEGAPVWDNLPEGV